MKIIISPTKKMNETTDIMQHKNKPKLINKSEELLKYLKSLDYDELKDIWKCSDKLATYNFERIQDINLHNRLNPAIFSYEGIQFQYMGVEVFENDEYEYLENHLRILSGLYGLLKPLDGIREYRLEMQSKIDFNGCNNLYDYWSDNIYNALDLKENELVINLASKEYSKCVSKYIDKSKFITCVFGELIDGKVKEKGTLAKMARGEMVRYLAKNKVENIEGIKNFDYSNYKYSEEYSTKNKIVFIRDK